MSTTTLNIPKLGQRVVLTVSPRKYDFLMELLYNFDFVQVEEEENDGDSREEIIANLQQAASDVKLIREGKLEGRPAREFLNELWKMAYNVKTIRHFEREFKRLSKKYASLKSEFEELIGELEIDPEKGTSLGNNVYKIRLAIASKGKGKSGGARVITYLKTQQENIYLVTIYDKSEKSAITDREIQKILESEDLVEWKLKIEHDEESNLFNK